MLPTDLLNLIFDFYISMSMFETKQRLFTEFRKLQVTRHLDSFFGTTLEQGEFSPSFCLAVLKYMKIHKMNVLIE